MMISDRTLQSSGWAHTGGNIAIMGRGPYWSSVPREGFPKDMASDEDLYRSEAP
ncbi:hypothetical protein BJY21_003220 [Kineosphaera limosa]|nr:hypothetical protein [Kineosphaera limosa]